MVGPAVALVVASDDEALLGRLRTAAGSTAPFDGVLSVLVTHGVERLPALALASAEGAAVRAIVRGEGRIEAHRADGTTSEVTADPEVRTWLEAALDGASRVRVRLTSDPVVVDVLTAPATTATV